MGICEIDDCGKPAICKGLCRSHDNKARYAAAAEHHRARARAWYRRNPEKAKATRDRRDPQAMRAAAKQWYAANRLRAIASQANARARRLGIAGLLTADGIRARFEYFGGRCWICRIGGADSIDHVISLGAGGPNFHSNIRPAHLGCNAARSWEGRR